MGSCVPRVQTKDDRLLSGAAEMQDAAAAITDGRSRGAKKNSNKMNPNQRVSSDE